MPVGSGALADAERADPVSAKRSDLRLRLVSALVMVAVAGAAFWLGGWALAAFIVALGLGILLEWTQLAFAAEARAWARALWLLAGAGYIGLACLAALQWIDDVTVLLEVVASVIAVDVGAYFAGRTFGGPKIAPAISPSKTWSGLLGGIVGASLVYATLAAIEHGVRFQGADAGAIMAGDEESMFPWARLLWIGPLVAVIAQSGDFFESWLKRRAGVKDSGRLIPGHGGLFDRADGMIAVLFVIGVFTVLSAMSQG
jgi:phosphatidate cytidylyltransferase